MGSPKTKTVGGGQASGTADAFNKFLMGGMNGGGFSGPNGAATGVGQAAGQTASFGSAIDSMLAGKPGDPNSYSSYFDLLKQGGNGGSSFNRDITGSVFGANPGTSSVAGTGALLNYSTDSPEFAALKHIQDMRTQRGVADLRARFGTGGGNSFGTGASQAEAQYLSEANPANTLALGDLGRQMQTLDMNNRGQNGQLTAQHIQQLLSSFGLDANNAMQDQGQKNQFALGSAGVGQNMFNAQSANVSNVLAQIFGSLNQANALGTPQAQTVQEPSMFGQIMQGIGQVVDIGSKVGTAAAGFSKGGSSGGVPNFSLPPIQQTPNNAPFGAPGGYNFPIVQPQFPRY